MIKIEVGFTFMAERKTTIVEIDEDLWAGYTDEMRADYIDDAAFQFLFNQCETYGYEVK